MKTWLDKLKRYDGAIRELHRQEAEQMGYQSGFTAIADDISMDTGGLQDNVYLLLN